MFTAKQKITSRSSEDILAEAVTLAGSEGRPLQALIDEALEDLFEKRRNYRPRAQVMRAYHTSHEAYAELYQKLAQ